MMTLNLILRHVEHRAYRRLAQAVLGNGRCGLERFRQRLTGPGAARVAALGLGLQRISELSHTPAARQAAAVLREQLVAAQRADGLFGDGEEADLTASCVALVGLLAQVHRPAEPWLIEALSHYRGQLWRQAPRLSALDAAIILWQRATSSALASELNDPRILRALHERADGQITHEETAFLHALAA